MSIKVTNWSSYQSYKDRKPPWIRLHRALIDNYGFQTMTAESRALLPMLWLLACEDKDPTSGVIPYDCEQIAFRLRIRNEIVTESLQELSDSDFIEIKESQAVDVPSCNESVTEPYLDRTSTVTPETETETEGTMSVCSYGKEAMEWWNDEISPFGHSKVREVKGARLKKAKARKLVEHKDELTRQIKSMGAWTIEGNWFSFDWIIKNSENMNKLLEGKYSDKTSAEKPKQTCAPRTERQGYY